MKLYIVVLAFITAALVSARKPKWFFPRPTVTHYVHEQRLLTELVPSSCVVLETSLKPCRHLRQIQPSTPGQGPPMLMTPTPRLESNPLAPFSLKSSLTGPEVAEDRSWTSFFGLDPVKVTRTITQLITARSASPAAVVTFSVRGCRPSQLPFGLPLCSDSNITLSTTAVARISSTKDLHFVEEQSDKLQ